MKNSFILLLLLLPAFLLGVEKRDYWKPLTDEDKDNISFVISNLSAKSKFALVVIRNELQEAGDRTDHVHPLRYLGYVFGTPALKRAAQQIPQSIWIRFMRDFSKSLQEAYDNHNYSEKDVEAFSKQVGLNPQEVEAFIQNQNWRGLMNSLYNSGRD